MISAQRSFILKCRVYNPEYLFWRLFSASQVHLRQISGANAGYINFWREPIFASDCTTIRGKDDADTLMILNHLKLLQKYLFTQAKGSAQPHVYPNDIRQLYYTIVPNNFIEKYGNITVPMNDRIANNIKETQKLTELRDWLLPMLMNGQVTVREA